MEAISGLTRDVLDRARRSRDARFDGRFFIAVKTTRIYCRPICPARLSRDSNVRYYATAAEAAEAGFRPCLRCRPEAAPGSPAWMGTSAVVQRALRLIQDGALDHASLAGLARRLGIGVRHLGRLFAQHVGASPAAVAQTRRLLFAKRLLDDTRLPITDIALASGFGSIRRFNDVFRSTYRKSPRQLRKARRSGGSAAEAAQITLRLAYRPPYDWDSLCSFLGARSIPGVEMATAEHYARAVRTPTGHAVLQFRPVPSANALELRIEGALPAELPSLLSSARRMFDLTADPARIGAALSADALLRPLIAQRPGLRIPGVWDPFECSVRAVVGQQMGAAADKMLGRMIARWGEPIEPLMTGITHLFPSPAALADADLETLGLGGGRCETLRRLSRGVRDENIRFDAPWQETEQTLRAIPGIGRWTAGYIELRGLGEPDALPFGDRILRRRADAGGAKPLSPLELEARAECWRPFRGYAALLLWAADRATS